MFSLLANGTIWNLSRIAIDGLFGSYKTRIQVIRNFGIDNKMSIIDIGCGIGQYSTMTNGKYLGIDFSKNYIQTAKKLYGSKSKQFLCEDVNEVNLNTSPYDVALLIDMTHHLSDEENENLIRKLNFFSPRYIIISDPIAQSAHNLLGRFLAYLDRGKYIRSKKELIDLISKNLLIKKVVPIKIMGIEGVCILAHPRK